MHFSLSFLDKIHPQVKALHVNDYTCERFSRSWASLYVKAEEQALHSTMSRDTLHHQWKKFFLHCHSWEDPHIFLKRMKFEQQRDIVERVKSRKQEKAISISRFRWDTELFPHYCKDQNQAFPAIYYIYPIYTEQRMEPWGTSRHSKAHLTRLSI